MLERMEMIYEMAVFYKWNRAVIDELTNIEDDEILDMYSDYLDDWQIKDNEEWSRLWQ